ncbi:hypothetical protein [Streptomyces atroolivaceus]
MALHETRFGRALDGPEPAVRWQASQPVHGPGCSPVRGEEDDQLLGVGGEVERLAEQPEFAPGRVVETQDPALRDHMTVQAAGEALRTAREANPYPA